MACRHQDTFQQHQAFIHLSLDTLVKGATEFNLRQPLRMANSITIVYSKNLAIYRVFHIPTRNMGHGLPESFDCVNERDIVPRLALAGLQAC